jgi:hypothetical protein
MILYAIRHKATKQLMPLMKRGKGYSHWNPSAVKYKIHSELNIPRLLESEKQAKKVITNWYYCPNGKNIYWRDHESGYWENDIEFKSDERKKDDLEIVKVIVSVRK